MCFVTSYGWVPLLYLIGIFTGQGIHLKPTNQEITQSLFQDQEFTKKSQITVKSQNRTIGDTLPVNVIVASDTVKAFLNAMCSIYQIIINTIF